MSYVSCNGSFDVESEISLQEDRQELRYHNRGHTCVMCERRRRVGALMGHCIVVPLQLVNF